MKKKRFHVKWKIQVKENNRKCQKNRVRSNETMP